MANKRKRLNPRRRAENKPAVEGKFQGVYLLPRSSETLHISEIIKKITDGEAIKIPVDKCWLDEAKEVSEKQMAALLDSHPVTTRFITSITPPDWVTDIVREAFKRAEYVKP